MDWKEQIKKEFPAIEWKMAEPMAKHTTFRIGGLAELYAEPNIRQVCEVIAYAKQAGVPVTILGNGSNVLVADEGIAGLVLSFGKAASKIEVRGKVLHAEAGALLSQVAHAAAKKALSGLEFAAGIPGTIGGALLMNAGAYGGEMKNVVTSAQLLLSNGTIATWSKEQLDLSYRHSRMMEEQAVILSVEMELSPGSEQEIYEKMEDFRQKRIEKQPLEYPSAGSTFKRPPENFAGKLIMEAGLAGFQVGDAAVSEKHCGFVINKGNATAAQVRELMKQVSERVLEKDGVLLEPEVRFLGNVQEEK